MNPYEAPSEPKGREAESNRLALLKVFSMIIAMLGAVILYKQLMEEPADEGKSWTLPPPYYLQEGLGPSSDGR